MKTLISAEVVRHAKAGGATRLPGGKQVLITPEARGLAEQWGLSFDPQLDHFPDAHAAPAEADAAQAAIRAAVIARLPPDAAANADLVDQIVGKVRAASQSPTLASPAAQPTAPAAAPTSGGIRLVRGADVRLGVFPGAGAEKQVGIADVITAADGAPIAAGFMAWSQSAFPWTLDYDEIDLVLEGELQISCQGTTLVGRAGDVFYIPKGSRIEFGTPTAVRFFYVTYPANWQG